MALSLPAATHCFVLCSLGAQKLKRSRLLQTNARENSLANSSKDLLPSGDIQVPKPLGPHLLSLGCHVAVFLSRQRGELHWFLNETE